MARQEIVVRSRTLEEQLAESGFERAQLHDEMPGEAEVDAWQGRAEELATRIQRLGPINLAAIAQLTADFPDLDLVLIESGGDNLAATFSPELADLTIYVIDVSGGDKIPRKGGPGITRSDLLVINKTDLAPHVGASLEVMERDARRMRGERPFVFTNVR